MADSDEKRLEKVFSHLEQTLGTIPESIKLLGKYSVGTLEGYCNMREYLLRDPPDGALSKKTKEILYVVLDSVIGNVEGAKIHAKVAINLGVKLKEIVEALGLAIMLTGIGTWEKAGYEVIKFAEEIQAKEK